MVHENDFELTFANGTSCRKISMKLITLLDKNPDAEKSSGEVTLLIAINISTYRTIEKGRGEINTGVTKQKRRRVLRYDYSAEKLERQAKLMRIVNVL